MAAAGFEIKGSLACGFWGSRTHMGSIGKQVPLPLHHQYATSTGAGASCSLSDPCLVISLPPLHLTDSASAGVSLLVIGVNDTTISKKIERITHFSISLVCYVEYITSI